MGEPRSGRSGGTDRAVVVGVDGSENSRWALKWAGEEAKHRGASLHIVHAATGHEDTPAWYEAGSSGLSPGEAIIDDAYGLVATSHPSVVARAQVLGGPPVAELTRVSRSAELLVVGARGRGGFSELLVGSVSDQCIQYAHCPVVVVRTDPDELPPPAAGSRIVVGIDGSLGSTRALRWALAEAQVRSAPVLGVYAWQYPPIGTFVADSRQGQEQAADEILHAATDYAAQWAPEVPFTAEARFGTTVPALLHESGEAELLVVGATGHGGFDGSLVGSVAHQCARHARCPVVVAHLQAEPDPAKGTRPGRARIGSNQP